MTLIQYQFKVDGKITVVTPPPPEKMFVYYNYYIIVILGIQGIIKTQ